MKMRALLVLLALPLLAFDCGGKDAPAEKSPYGLDCKLHMGGGVQAEDLWCINTAYDYSAFPDPELVSSTWIFELVAYRGMVEVGASASIVAPASAGARYDVWLGRQLRDDARGGRRRRTLGRLALQRHVHADA